MLTLKADAQLDPKTYSKPALEAFFNMARLWNLTAEEQMGLLGLGHRRSTLFHWKKNGGLLPVDTLERISYLLGIYKALQMLLPDREAADAWVKRANTAPLFGGKPPLDRMLKGLAGLFVVRQYLDGERSGW